MQRAAVAASCVVFWLWSSSPSITPKFGSFLLGVLTLLTCVEKLCSVMNMISVERDWVSYTW